MRVCVIPSDAQQTVVKYKNYIKIFKFHSFKFFIKLFYFALYGKVHECSRASTLH